MDRDRFPISLLVLIMILAAGTYALIGAANRHDQRFNSACEIAGGAPFHSRLGEICLARGVVLDPARTPKPHE